MTVLNIFRTGVPEGAVVIMRSTKWGNRFKIEPGRTREQAMAAYRQELWDKIGLGIISREELAALHGKDLVCCCAPRLCHGHILEQAAEWAYNQIQA